jgi:uncharacterized protein YceK
VLLLLEMAHLVFGTGTNETRTRCRKLAGRLLALSGFSALLCVAPLGCGTVNSYASGCPAAYSGIRSDAEVLRELGSFWQDGFDWITVIGDLPLSLVGDTVLAPIGPLVDENPASPAGLGCEWARRESKHAAP